MPLGGVQQMNFRSIVVVAVVAAAAWGTGVLMRTTYQQWAASSGRSISAPTPAELERLAPRRVPVADRSQDAEPGRTPTTGIDCTRGVACPIIYAPRRER
jgi:hypothetical protein